MAGIKLALTLGNWSLSRDEIVGNVVCTVRAVIESRNKFWETQSPFELQLWMGGSSWWVWKKVERHGDGMFRIYGDPTVIEREVRL